LAKYRYSTIFWPPPNRLPPSFLVFLSSSMSVAQIITPATFWTPNPTGITPPYVEEETSRSPRRGPSIFGPLEPNRKPPSSAPAAAPIGPKA
jgi:hypothetical protein